MVGFNKNNCRFQGKFDPHGRGRHWSPDPLLSRIILVVQFVAESRFANCEFANLFFDFDELQFSRFQIFSHFVTKISET